MAESMEAACPLWVIYGLKRASPLRRLLEVKRTQIVKMRTHVLIGGATVEHVARGGVVTTEFFHAVVALA